MFNCFFSIPILEFLFGQVGKFYKILYIKKNNTFFNEAKNFNREINQHFKS